MGHVKFQTTAEGRGCMEWYQICLAEPDTIKELIRHRMEYDDFFLAKDFYTYDAITSNGVPMFREPVEVVYIDLDKLIDQCDFNENQLYILKHLMYQDTYQEIADDISWDRENVKSEFDRMVKRMVYQNNYNWQASMESSGMVKINDTFRYRACTKCGKIYQINNKNFKFDKTNACFKAACRRCDN